MADQVTATDALDYLREHKGMSFQHMDVLYAYVAKLHGSLERIAGNHFCIDSETDPSVPEWTICPQCEADSVLGEGAEWWNDRAIEEGR